MVDLPVLPEMRCDRHCGECCGVVMCSEDDYQRVKRYAKRRGIKPLEQGIDCPFYQDGQCAVYEARPLICRMYGHFADDKLTCPRGYNVNMPLRVKDLFDERIIAASGKPRFLHEMLPGGIEILHEGLAVRIPAPTPEPEP